MKKAGAAPINIRVHGRFQIPVYLGIGQHWPARGERRLTALAAVLAKMTALAAVAAFALLAPAAAWHQTGGADEQLWCEELGLHASCNETYGGATPVTCSTSECDAPAPEACPAMQVPNSDKAAAGSIFGLVGSRIPVVCDDGFEGSGTVEYALHGVPDEHQ